MLSRRGPVHPPGRTDAAWIGGRMLMDRKRPMEPGGSHRITWERCPRCGRRAAVGWRALGATDSSGSEAELAVEFDCVTGCGLSLDELVRSFPSSARARPRSFPDPDVRTRGSGEPSQAARAESEPGSHSPASAPAVTRPLGATRPERVDTVELIPGHTEALAEVWLWHGRVPEVSDAPRVWVSLQADDWPMCPEVARRLAAALLTAAAMAEARGPGHS